MAHMLVLISVSLALSQTPAYIMRHTGPVHCMVGLFTIQLLLVKQWADSRPDLVDTGGCLHTKIVYHLQTVTHPCTNRAQCTVTSLIKSNVLPQSQRAA